MADDNSTSFVLNLDNSQFLAAAQGALGAIQSIGESSESLSSLIEMAGEIGIALAAVGVAAYAFKEALDLTIEGEEIQRVENQFNTLAAQAGLSATALKTGMEQAAGGLISTNDLLVLANSAIIKMGSSASNLPEIMELARKATQVFGGDVSTTFNNLVQAISMGNTRMLKHYGIVIDTTQAINKFADANGVARNALSEAGKQQALMNAAMAAAEKTFKDVTLQTGTTTTALQTFKVAWTELKETVAVVISSALGPTLKSFFGSVADMAKSARTHLLAAFGHGEAQDTAKIDLLKGKINDLKKTIDDIPKEGVFIRWLAGNPEERTAKLRSEVEKLEGQLKQMEQAEAVSAKNDQQRTDKKIQNRQALSHAAIDDQEKEKKNEEKFQQEMLKIDSATEKDRERNINSIDQVDASVKKQQLDRQKTYQNNISKIANDGALNDQQKWTLMQKERERYQQQEMNHERQDNTEREKMMTQYGQNSTNVFDGIGRAAQKTSMKAKADMKDFGAQGDYIMGEFSKSSTSAFDQIGQGIAKNQNVAKAAADAMKAAFLGMIGDVAQHYGEMLLLESIWPPNPIGLAAGAALITLGGVLHGLAGSSSSSGGVSTGVGGGSSSSSSSLSAPGQTTGTATTTQASQEAALAQQQTVQRSVNINIAGNLLNTQESQRTLMEVMRNETDATGFQYNKIGV